MTLAALLAGGLDAERAAALIARAAAARAEMLLAASVTASPGEAHAAEIARGSSAGATADLATALARGASPAAAAAIAAIAAAERAAALEASMVTIAEPQLAAMGQRALDGATITVTRRGQPLTSRQAGSLTEQAAQQPSPMDEASTDFATGRLPALFFIRLSDTVQAHRILGTQLRQGMSLEQIRTNSLLRSAVDASHIEDAQVLVEEFVQRLGAADLSSDYLATLMSRTTHDRFLRVLGQMLHRAEPPAEALQRAREQAKNP